MSYRYRCQQCRTTSPVLSRAAAEAEGQRHRDRFHGGHVPDGERLLHVGPERDEWWTQKRAVYVALAIVAVIAWLKGYRL